MSNREIAKIAREIKEIKSSLNKTSAGKGDLYTESSPYIGILKIWKKNVTPEEAEKLINEEMFDNTSLELVFVPNDGGPEMMFTDKWEQI